MKRMLFFAFLLGLLTNAATGAELNPEAAAWLVAQTNIQTWSANLKEIRKLKSLALPLTATGHVWFSAPNRFRWELGQPPQTIAVRTSDEMLIFYPNLKRVEKFVLTQAGPWRDALALLQAGFPRSQAELDAQYNILSQSAADGIGKLVLQPKSTAARRMMPQIEIDFDTRDHSLRATELEFADGSTMRNEFDNIELNPKLDEKLFNPPVPADYQVVEPLKER